MALTYPSPPRPFHATHPPTAHMAKQNLLNSIERMYRKGIIALKREIDRLELLTREDRLPVTAARALREYMTLLKNLRIAQKEIQAERATKAKEAVKQTSEDALVEAALKR